MTGSTIVNWQGFYLMNYLAVILKEQRLKDLRFFTALRMTGAAIDN
jgi:hypothetical protein